MFGQFTPLSNAFLMIYSSISLTEYRDLLSVATHELGHSMGLGHSSVQTSVMYPYYLSKWKRVELDQDDIAGMQKIYGESSA